MNYESETNSRVISSVLDSISCALGSILRALEMQGAYISTRDRTRSSTSWQCSNNAYYSQNSQLACRRSARLSIRYQRFFLTPTSLERETARVGFWLSVLRSAAPFFSFFVFPLVETVKIRGNRVLLRQIEGAMEIGLRACLKVVLQLQMR